MRIEKGLIWMARTSGWMRARRDGREEEWTRRRGHGEEKDRMADDGKLAGNSGWGDAEDELAGPVAENTAQARI